MYWSSNGLKFDIKLIWWKNSSFSWMVTLSIFNALVSKMSSCAGLRRSQVRVTWPLMAFAAKSTSQSKWMAAVRNTSIFENEHGSISLNFDSQNLRSDQIKTTNFRHVFIEQIIELQIICVSTHYWPVNKQRAKMITSEYRSHGHLNSWAPGRAIFGHIQLFVVFFF